MKYFLDQEFIEGFRKSLFGKRRHFIDLISIGIVAEDGREYYAISNEWNYNDASDWVKENIIHKLPLKLMNKESVGEFLKRTKNVGEYKGEWFGGKSNTQIASEIYQFICPYEEASYAADCGSIDAGADAYLIANPPEFYGYYADYDWVLFCSLFGTMMDLPKGFPRYCRDLKQMLDGRVEWFLRHRHLRSGETYVSSFADQLDILKSNLLYPKETNEHNALADARWNKKLYEFLLRP